MSESNSGPYAATPLPMRSSQYDDLLTPGVVVEIDPLEADSLGFFHEVALSAAEAWDANKDLSNDMANGASGYAETVAAAVVHQLRGGTAPWTQQGAPTGERLPYNPVSNAAYRGANALWLVARADALGSTDPRWMTHSQVAAAGGYVRRGEVGTPIQFWQHRGAVAVRGEDGQVRIDERGRPAVQMVQYEKPRLLSAVLFNGEQIEGLPPLSKAGQLQAPQDLYLDESSVVELPDPIGSDGRAREELQMQLSEFLMGEDRPPTEQTPPADLVRDWIGLIERDPHEIFRAAAAAEAALDAARGAGRSAQDQEAQPATQLEAGPDGFQGELSRMSVPILIPRDHPAMAVTEDRTYLAVPYAEKDDAKALGAKWDRQAKAWFVPAGVQLDAFQPWLPAMGQVHIAVDSDPRTEFAQALRDAGLRIDGAPQMDGSMQRVPAEGDRGPERSGAYVGYLDGRPAGFIQNFRTGARLPWKASGNAAPLDALDRAQMAAEAAQRRHDRAVEREKQYERVAQEVDAIWTAATPVDAHPYLAAKSVPSHGLREAEDGRLLVPIRDAEGKIWSLQHIARGSTKQFHPEGRLEGGHYVIGDLEQAGPLLIAEGYATSATVHAVTGQPTVVAFNAGNLLPVAETYRRLFPDRTIFIAGDNDHRRETEGKPNVGAQKAEQASAAIDGFVLLPPFGNGDAGSDWNDLVQAKGAEYAKLQISVGIAIAERELLTIIAPTLDEQEFAPPADLLHQSEKTITEQAEFER